MTPKQVIAHWKTKARAARVLGISSSSISEWEENGEVPELRQYQIQIASGGALQADLAADRTLGQEIEA